MSNYIHRYNIIFNIISVTSMSKLIVGLNGVSRSISALTAIVLYCTPITEIVRPNLGVGDIYYSKIFEANAICLQNE